MGRSLSEQSSAWALRLEGSAESKRASQQMFGGVRDAWVTSASCCKIEILFSSGEDWLIVKPSQVEQT